MSEIENDVLTDLLAYLQVHVDNHKVLAVLPLVFVAWSDGKMQVAEREKILEASRSFGFVDEGGMGLLETWLEEEPTLEYYQKGFEALIELARRERGPGSDISASSLQDLISLGTDVAKAAGGLFGKYWTVSAEEEVALVQIANALAIDDGNAWQELQGSLEKGGS